MLRQHARLADIHGRVAARLCAEGLTPVLDVLYHLADPRHALTEARRVLRPGGMLAVALPSRHDSPELKNALPCTRLTVDAESAPAMLSEVFVDIEVERWDAPLLNLPTRADVRDYLVGKGADPQAAAAAAATARVPLEITKRGALLYARAGQSDMTRRSSRIGAPRKSESRNEPSGR